TMVFVVITATIGGMQIFDEVRMFDAQGLGGPSRDWMTTVLYLYNVAWGNQKDLGRAAAVAWLLFLLILLIGLINFYLTTRIATVDGDEGRRRRRRRKPVPARNAGPGALPGAGTARTDRSEPL